MGKRLRLNEIDQALVYTVGLVLLALIYLVFFHEERPPYCSANLPVDEAVERGCPVLQQDVRLIMRA